MAPEKLLEEDQLIGMRPAREAPVRTIVHSLNERGVSYCKYLQRHVACACKAHFLPYLVEAARVATISAHKVTAADP